MFCETKRFGPKRRDVSAQGSVVRTRIWIIDAVSRVFPRSSYSLRAYQPFVASCVFRTSSESRKRSYCSSSDLNSERTSSRLKFQLDGIAATWRFLLCTRTNDYASNVRPTMQRSYIGPFAPFQLANFETTRPA